MSDYKIGKDMGELFARVKRLEENTRPSPCKGSEHESYSPAVSDDELLRSLQEAASNEEVYSILKQLVTDAGHITIRQLFTYTRNDVNPAVVSSITKAKDIGFLSLSNDKCCHEVDDPFEDDYCKAKTGKWCSLVKKQTKWMCTLASDKC